MTDTDATEFARELATITREAVDAAVAAVRAETAGQFRAERAQHAAYVEGAEAVIAALTERLHAVEQREIPEPAAPPTVDEVAAKALEQLSPVLEEAKTQWLDVEAATAKADALGTTLKSLSDRVTDVERREPEKGEKGDDGVAPTADEVAAAFDARAEARIASHLLDLERRGMDKIERAIAAIPRPKDGRDAVDVSGFRAELGEDQRTVTFSLVRDGEVVASESIRFPTLLYHGIYSESREYAANDAVTFGGSVWIAKHDAPAGKPGNSDDWQLAVKRGQAGRDGERVVLPAPGTPVKIGGGK